MDTLEQIIRQIVRDEVQKILHSTPATKITQPQKKSKPISLFDDNINIDFGTEYGGESKEDLELKKELDEIEKADALDMDKIPF